MFENVLLKVHCAVHYKCFACSFAKRTISLTVVGVGSGLLNRRGSLLVQKEFPQLATMLSCHVNIPRQIAILNFVSIY